MGGYVVFLRRGKGRGDTPCGIPLPSRSATSVALPGLSLWLADIPFLCSDGRWSLPGRKEGKLSNGERREEPREAATAGQSQSWKEARCKWPQASLGCLPFSHKQRDVKVIKETWEGVCSVEPPTPTEEIFHTHTQWLASKQDVTSISLIFSLPSLSLSSHTWI